MTGKLTRNEMRGVMAGRQAEGGFTCTCANGVTWTSYSATNCIDICAAW
ncbi:hypothetical protein ACNQGP_01525 [Flavobacterium sp. GT2N3]